MKKFLLFILSLALATDATALTLSNFQVPESVVVDWVDGSYYVSNINGAPTDKDANGYISKINANGNIVIQKFIGGKANRPLLDAPKGMVILGKNLYVTDIDTVKGFDKETGKQVFFSDLAPLQPKFLNDLAIDEQGQIYVSDMMANFIARINPKSGKVDLVKEGAVLGNPNGIKMNPKSKNLMVATWGSGQVLEIDRFGAVHVLKRSLMTLDGIDYDADGNLYISSFEKGEIYKIPNYGRGSISTFLSGLTTPADIACDRKKGEILIPSFKGNTVISASVRKDLTPKK